MEALALLRRLTGLPRAQWDNVTRIPDFCPSPVPLPAGWLIPSSPGNGSVFFFSFWVSDSSPQFQMKTSFSAVDGVT